MYAPSFPQRLLLVALILFTAVATCVAVGAGPAHAACPANVAIGVGGNTDGNANVFGNMVERRAVYSGMLNDFGGALGAIDREVNAVRSSCPGTFILLAGHSQGGAAVHVWAAQHPRFGNIKIFAYADPKLEGRGASQGVFLLGGPPVAGTDSNFGANPYVTLCRGDDLVCNSPFGIPTPAHNMYNFNPRAWLGANGVVWV